MAGIHGCRRNGHEHCRRPYSGRKEPEAVPQRPESGVARIGKYPQPAQRPSLARGWTPRIQTYPGREVPNPLIIEISKGEADINVVVRDILSLTKLNYNTCIFGDGMRSEERR